MWSVCNAGDWGWLGRAKPSLLLISQQTLQPQTPTPPSLPFFWSYTFSTPVFHPHQKECTLLKLTVYPLEIDPNMSLLLGGRELIGFCPENEALLPKLAPRSQNLLTPPEIILSTIFLFTCVLLVGKGHGAAIRTPSNCPSSKGTQYISCVHACVFVTMQFTDFVQRNKIHIMPLIHYVFVLC